MKCRIVVEDVTQLYDGRRMEFSRSQVWEGELELLESNVYMTKVSIIAEGREHPICDIPFSMDTGHWIWVPELHAIPRRFANLIVDADAPEAEELSEFTITPAALAGPHVCISQPCPTCGQIDQKPENM